MVELVDTLDSKSGEHYARAGSIPVRGTRKCSARETAPRWRVASAPKSNDHSILRVRADDFLYSTENVDDVMRRVVSTASLVDNFCY